MQQIQEIMERYFWRMPSIIWTDIVEIAIISFLIYHILVWVKNTKAWSLLKGVVTGCMMLSNGICSKIVQLVTVEVYLTQKHFTP